MILPFTWSGLNPGDLGLGVDDTGTWFLLERTTEHWQPVHSLPGDHTTTKPDVAMTRLRELQQMQQARRQGRRQPLRPGTTVRQLNWPALQLIHPASGEAASWPHRFAAHYRLRPALDEELDIIASTRRQAPKGPPGQRSGHGTLSELLARLIGQGHGHYVFLGINRIAVHLRREWHMLVWADEHGNDLHQLPRAPRRTAPRP